MGELSTIQKPVPGRIEIIHIKVRRKSLVDEMPDLYLNRTKRTELFPVVAGLKTLDEKVSLCKAAKDLNLLHLSPYRFDVVGCPGVPGIDQSIQINAFTELFNGR